MHGTREVRTRTADVHSERAASVHSRAMSTSRDSAMVLPLDDEAALFRWTGERLEQREGVSIPRTAPWAASIEGDLLCYAAKNELTIVRGVFSGEPEAPQVIAVPGKEYDFHCVALKGGVLFAAGRCGEEIIGWLDTEADEPVWRPLEVHTDAKHWGKSVDSLLIDGDRLIGLDDILLPKWWLVYDASDPRASRLVEHPSLAPHSTYEVFHHATLAHEVVAAVSWSINHGVASVHLSLYERGTLSEIGSVRAAAGPLSARFGGRSREGARDFLHVDGFDELLVLSAGSEGVGLLDLREIDTVARPRENASRLASYRAEFATRVNEKLRWRSREGHAAVRAYFCDAAHVAISWQNAAGQCWVELVKVQS